MDTLNVLVADDEREMRRAIDKALSKYTIRVPDVDHEVGFVVQQAGSGEEALEKIEAAPPDLLLLDYKMQGMSGLEVLDQVARKNLDMLTLMVTAYASLETAVTATKRGAFDFIAKPFTPAELKDTVGKATRHLIAQRQARQLAQEKRQVRFQFISVLAHELKAPLGAIEGYLNILKDRSMRNDPDTVDQMVNRCLIRSEGMRKLIYDLLDLTRIESGQKKRDIAEVNLAEVAQTSVDTLRPDAEAQQITIAMEADESLVLDGDRSEIEIIFNNLISNAVKYNRPEGRVTVTVFADGEDAVIEVTDTGIGMTADEAAKLFQDFVRIKNKKTKNVLGSGLGLSTVKKLANLYQGSASVSSEPDVGSTFTVRLNRHSVPPKDSHDSPGPTEVAG